MAKLVLAASCVLFWGYLAYVGFDLISGVARGVATGHANVGQWDFYVIFPAAMAVLGIVLVAISRKVPTALYVAVLVIEILPILPFLLVYGGGMQKGTKPVATRSASKFVETGIAHGRTALGGR